MTQVLAIVGLALAGMVSTAHAGLGFDGCYQLYLPGALYPAFCLEGTAEEGINGAGVRLVIFRTNTNRVAHCSKSSGSGMTSTSFEYLRDGKVELTLRNVAEKNGRKEGEAVFGRTSLKFLELDATTSARLMKVARQDASCLEAGW